MGKPIFHNIDTCDLGVCARQYVFTKHIKGTDRQETDCFKGVVSFVTEDGYFAALGHAEEYAYLEQGAIDLFDQRGDCGEPEYAGYALRVSPTGIHGKLIDSCTPPVKRTMKILPMGEICLDRAEVWMPFHSSDPIRYVGKIVGLPTGDAMGSIFFEADDPNILGIHTGIEGSVIVQDGRIAAVVRRVNGKTLECVSAELVAADLFRTMYEHAFCK